MDDQFTDATTETIPRINASMLPTGQFNGQEVAIVGEILSQDHNDNTIFQMKGPDGQQFRVKVDPSNFQGGYQSKFVEVRGRACNNGSIEQISHHEYGNEFAMDTHNKFVLLTHQYPNLF